MVEVGGTHSSSSAGSCSSQQGSTSTTRSLLQKNNMNEIYLLVFQLEMVQKAMMILLELPKFISDLKLR